MLEVFRFRSGYSLQSVVPLRFSAFVRSTARNVRATPGLRLELIGVCHIRHPHLIPPSLQAGYLMLRYALIFLLIALVASLFGMYGLVGISMEIARILFFVFLVLLVISFFTGRRRPLS